MTAKDVLAGIGLAVLIIVGLALIWSAYDTWKEFR